MPRRVDHPPSPWQSRCVSDLEEPPPPATLELHEEEARTILSENDSPDVPYRDSINPYRGCCHACACCDARPSHDYVGCGAGTDCDRRIVAKTHAAGLLDDALSRGRARGETLAFSGVTDCRVSGSASPPQLQGTHPDAAVALSRRQRRVDRPRPPA